MIAAVYRYLVGDARFRIRTCSNPYFYGICQMSAYSAYSTERCCLEHPASPPPGVEESGRRREQPEGHDACNEASRRRQICHAKLLYCITNCLAIDVDGFGILQKPSVEHAADPVSLLVLSVNAGLRASGMSRSRYGAALNGTSYLGKRCKTMTLLHPFREP